MFKILFILVSLVLAQEPTGPLADVVPPAAVEEVSAPAAVGVDEPTVDEVLTEEALAEATPESLVGLVEDNAVELGSYAAATGIGYLAGTATYALSKKRKTKKAARLLKRLTPVAKIVVGTVVGGALAAILGGATLPVALGIGLAAGVSAVTGRQVVTKTLLGKVKE